MFWKVSLVLAFCKCSLVVIPTLWPGVHLYVQTGASILWRVVGQHQGTHSTTSTRQIHIYTDRAVLHCMLVHFMHCMLVKKKGCDIITM